MGQISSMFGNVPGFGTVFENFESAFMWGPYPRYFAPAYIASTAADPTNSITYDLRMGLVMGKIAATGTWTNYSATATDGSNVAQGILPIGIRMQDVLSGVNTTKFYAMLVSGGVQSAKLIGLDNQARAQLSNRFYFDDNLIGNVQFPFQQQVTKTANYQIVASDNLTLFNTLGATGEVDFTLPAIANGYFFAFSNQAAQTLKVISKEGANIIALNNLTASSAAFSTGGQQIGAGMYVYSNPAATKWIVELSSAGATTVTLT